MAAGTVTINARAKAGDGAVSQPSSVTFHEKDLKIEGQPQTAEYAKVGDQIKYTYTISGQSLSPLDGTPKVLGDSLKATCQALSSIGNSNNLLEGNESINCTANHTITQEDIDRGSVKNTITAYLGSIQSLPIAVTVKGPPPNPKISLSNTAADNTYNSVGETVTYQYVVTNTGNVTLEPGVRVADDHVAGGAAFDCGGGKPLAPGSSVTCTGSYVTTPKDLNYGDSTVTNNVSATGSFQGSPVTSAPASTTVRCPYPPSGWDSFSVSAGENLATISGWYPGTSVTAIQQANCMGVRDTEVGKTMYVPQPPPTASVSGVIRDGSQNPLSGIQVSLIKDGTVVDTATTGADGNYSFTGLQPGRYTIFQASLDLRRGVPVRKEFRIVASS
jgi:hypothetical protein